MRKFFRWIKEKFFTKSFLSFVIIGVINTIINTIINSIFVWFISKCFVWIHGEEILADDPLYIWSVAVSTLVAFIAASLFTV